MQPWAFPPSIPRIVPRPLQPQPPLPPGQFTSLHTLSVHCASKSCSDFEALPLIQTLRWLQLSQFSFDGDAIRRGPSRCLGLQALHLDSQQVGS
jgi:hypothetical protein